MVSPPVNFSHANFTYKSKRLLKGENREVGKSSLRPSKQNLTRVSSPSVDRREQEMLPLVSKGKGGGDGGGKEAEIKIMVFTSRGFGLAD